MGSLAKKGILLFLLLVFLAGTAQANITLTNGADTALFIVINTDDGKVTKLLGCCTSLVIKCSGTTNILVKSRDGRKRLCEGSFQNGDAVMITNLRESYKIQKIIKKGTKK